MIHCPSVIITAHTVEVSFSESLDRVANSESFEKVSQVVISDTSEISFELSQWRFFSNLPVRSKSCKVQMALPILKKRMWKAGLSENILPRMTLIKTNDAIQVMESSGQHPNVELHMVVWEAIVSSGANHSQKASEMIAWCIMVQ